MKYLTMQFATLILKINTHNSQIPTLYPQLASYIYIFLTFSHCSLLLQAYFLIPIAFLSVTADGNYRSNRTTSKRRSHRLVRNISGMLADSFLHVTQMSGKTWQTGHLDRLLQNILKKKKKTGATCFFFLLLGK